MAFASVSAGIFGGWARKGSNDLGQYGTALFIEGDGGPLAVNSLGTAKSDTTGMLGLHIGIVLPHDANMCFPLTPVIEFEGYYMNGISLNGHTFNDVPERLPEHDFDLNFPLKTKVFLINAVFNSHCAVFERFTPYLGVGFGSALGSISNATSLQVGPPEVGVNHYNGDPNSKSVTFAGQFKAGFGFDICTQLKAFAEYRYLYLGESKYTFGSTMAAGHAPTTTWIVKMDPTHYNMGIIGLEYCF